MDKRILKKIAKEWASGILFHGTGMDSFDTDSGLTQDEQGFIVEEVQRLGMSLMKGIGKEEPETSLDVIIRKYYEFI